MISCLLLAAVSATFTHDYDHDYDRPRDYDHDYDRPRDYDHDYECVLKDKHGKCITGGVLKAEDYCPVGGVLEVKDFDRYPGYKGHLNIKGWAKVWKPSVYSCHNKLGWGTKYDKHLVVEVSLSGLEKSFKYPFKGGIHIHEGTTCKYANEVGGHFWTPKYRPDPWNGDYSEWTSNKNGFTVDKHGNKKYVYWIDSGYTWNENFHHAFVIHESDGTRAACGILKIPDLYLYDQFHRFDYDHLKAPFDNKKGDPTIKYDPTIKKDDPTIHY